MAGITPKAMAARPGDGDQWLVESLGRGAGALVGRITKGGARKLYFRYTDSAGKQVRMPIGDFKLSDTDPLGLTVRAARAQAIEWSKVYQSGVRDLREHFAQLVVDASQAALDARREAEENRQREAQERERRLTMRQLFERWASVDLQPRAGADGSRTGRKDGGEYTRQQFQRHVFPTVGEMAVKDVQRADLMAVFDAQKAAGKLRTANVLLTDLKQMLRFATLRDIVDRNVLDGVEKRAIGGKEAERDRVLSDAEVRQLVELLPKARMGVRSELAIPAILATACRVGELMNAQWAHVDLDGAKWYIPASHSKNQRDHTIHLSAFALERFRALYALRERGTDGSVLPWVFPNRAGEGPVCIKSFGKQLADRQRQDESKRLSRRSLNTDALALTGGNWTAHDLRRTAATIMGRLGFSADVIDECLNHIIQSRVTRIYVRDRREADQARAFDALGRHLEGLWAGQGAGSNVVALRVAA